MERAASPRARLARPAPGPRRPIAGPPFFGQAVSRPPGGGGEREEEPAGAGAGRRNAGRPGLAAVGGRQGSLDGDEEKRRGASCIELAGAGRRTPGRALLPPGPPRAARPRRPTARSSSPFSTPRSSPRLSTPRLLPVSRPSPSPLASRPAPSPLLSPPAPRGKKNRQR